MGKRTWDLIDKTRIFWNECTGRPCTREDAMEMIANMSGLFRLLAEWDRDERRRDEDSGTNNDKYNSIDTLRESEK